MKRLAALAALAVSAAACEQTSSTPLPTDAVGSEISTSVVISQVYGGGGNVGATYRNDFVELFNKGNTTVNVTGWSVQYASATGSGWNGDKAILSGSIAPGGYYLLVLDSGANGVALPAADLTDLTFDMSLSQGKVALVSDNVSLVGTCPVGPTIVDFLGYGTTANCFEGVRLGNLSNTTAAIRKSAGCRDTDINVGDFTIGTPSARNSASPAGTCAPGGIGAGDPEPVGQGGTTRLTVTVTPGSAPASTGLAVVANLSAIMGSSGQMFFDDATNGDVTPGDNVFSYSATVSDSVMTGPKTLAFTVSDAEARLDTSGSFILNVVANAAPVAVDDSFSVLMDEARSLAVLANDTDAESDALDVTAITVDPLKGSAVIETDGTITFTPNPGELGADSFVYEITDSKGESDVATVTIEIRAVFAENDAYGATEEQTLVVNAPGVLANDEAAGSPTLTASVATGPANGSLTLSSDGSFSYTPAADFFGMDAFTYTAFSGADLSNAATVLLTVANVNDPPTAVADAYDVTEDVTLTRNAAAGVLANDEDPDPETLQAVLDAGPTNGMLTLNLDGSFVYVPDLDYNAGDSFTYHVNDGTVSSSTVTVTLSYTAVNDAPLAFADAYPLDEDTPILIGTTAGLVVNDTDVDSASLGAVVVDPPDFGTFESMAGGAFLYTPDADYHGPDSLTYRATDGTAMSAAAATVSFTIAPVNDSPTAVVDTYATAEDEPLSVVAPGLLVNDGDVDGNTITPVVDAQPAGGSVAISTNGSFVYTPAANFNGEDAFTYHVSDGVESSSIVSVAVTVSAVNDAPTIPVPASPAEGSSVDADDLVFSWSASSDADGDPLTYRVELLRDGALYAQSQSTTLTATIPGNLGTGDYAWRVMATDGDDGSGFSAEASFTITKSGGGGGGGIFGCSTTGRGGSPLASAALLAALAIVIRRRALSTLP